MSQDKRILTNLSSFLFGAKNKRLRKLTEPPKVLRKNSRRLQSKV